MGLESSRKVEHSKPPLPDHARAKTLVILHAPLASELKISMLLEKLRYYLDELRLHQSEVIVNPPHLSGNLEKGGELIDVVVGWGLPTNPEWDEWIRQHQFLGILRNFLAFDLFERFGLNGRRLDGPRVDAGEYWGQKVRAANFKLFLKGFYLRTVTPYALRRVQKSATYEESRQREARFVLIPGKPEKVQIVRLIFDLFVNHDYNRADISNLLNAQRVKAPGTKKIWTAHAVTAILKDSVYIGANSYLGAVRYDIFPAVLDKSIFFEAQSKIQRKSRRLDPSIGM